MFFFFKQKTAYEMRISDWSSDVCSSDLYHSPDCARIQPAALAAGLADTVERLGVTIHEQSAVIEIQQGRAVTRPGTVRAPIVLRAPEGFTPALPGLRRRWLPMNRPMTPTHPVPPHLWDRTGWNCERARGGNRSDRT